jgi:hypothetical protein
MLTRQHITKESTLADIECENDEYSNSISACADAAFLERLPLALSYTASLTHGDHAVLIFDNLVVAAEYFCAHINEGINKQELTCVIGLPRWRYQKLFEQVGVKVAQLENCGYLRHFSLQDFYLADGHPNKNKAQRNIENLLSTTKSSICGGVRFINIQEPPSASGRSFQELIDFEKWLGTLSSYPISMVCCYDARALLESPFSTHFTELLKVHEHCAFQGIAMPTNTLLGSRVGVAYPKLRSQ